MADSGKALSDGLPVDGSVGQQRCYGKDSGRGARDDPTGRNLVDAPLVLVIAGTDSSGGAGLVRDVQVITEFGARASCAITAVTAQTNSRVEASCALSPELVRRQIRTALAAGDVRAIKIGMLGNAAIVRAVLDALSDMSSRHSHPPDASPDNCKEMTSGSGGSRWVPIALAPDALPDACMDMSPARGTCQRIPIVLDPVLCSSSGTALLDPEGVQMLRDHLFSRCTLITPNLIEASVLLGEPLARTSSEQVRLAESLLRIGSTGVLLKGGHAFDDEALDVLVTKDKPPTVLRAKRVNVTMRGSGCSLSSAIAALMASGVPMQEACERAKQYVHDKLTALAS